MEAQDTRWEGGVSWPHDCAKQRRYKEGGGVGIKVSWKAAHSPSLKEQWIHLSSQVLYEAVRSSRFSRKPQIQIFRKLIILAYTYIALTVCQPVF